MTQAGIDLTVHDILESIKINYYAEHKGKTGLKPFCIISKYFHSKDCNKMTFIMLTSTILMGFFSVDKILKQLTGDTGSKANRHKGKADDCIQSDKWIPFCVN